jgi:dolichol-phosphate mannosyltransferase
VLFLGGVQLLSIGILGTYVASIFLEAKGRPNFIIRDVQGFRPAPEPNFSGVQSFKR